MRRRWERKTNRCYGLPRPRYASERRTTESTYLTDWSIFVTGNSMPPRDPHDDDDDDDEDGDDDQMKMSPR